MEKATLEELIARKTQGELDKFRIKSVDVGSAGFALEVKKIKLNEMLKVIDSVQNADSMTENVEFMKELVFKSCPILHSKKLQEAYECLEPYDVVLGILNDDIGALSNIVEEIMDFYGLGDKLESTIKN